MADITPRFISSYSRFFCGQSLRAISTGGPTSTAWYAANQAVYVPIGLPWTYTINRLFCHNGATASGNISLGIYQVNSSAGTLTQIYASGAVAQAGTDTLQFITPGSPLVLSQGSYLFGIALSSATGTVLMSSAVTPQYGRAAGLFQQATAMPLPASPTLATWASTGFPLVGVTRTSTGF